MSNVDFKFFVSYGKVKVPIKVILKNYTNFVVTDGTGSGWPLDRMEIKKWSQPEVRDAKARLDDAFQGYSSCRSSAVAVLQHLLLWQLLLWCDLYDNLFGHDSTQTDLHLTGLRI